MKHLSVSLALGVFLSAGVTIVPAQEPDGWLAMDDPDELRLLLSGKALEGTDFTDYYRSDGAMGYYNKNTDTTVVRKWVVRADGDICMYIYFKPDKLVACNRLHRSAEDPNLFRVTIEGRGYSMQGRLIETPPKALVDTVNDVARPSN